MSEWVSFCCILTICLTELPEMGNYWVFYYWTGNKHNVKVENIIRQDVEGPWVLIFVSLSCVYDGCLSIYALYATCLDIGVNRLLQGLDSQTCHSIFRCYLCIV